MNILAILFDGFTQMIMELGLTRMQSESLIFLAVGSLVMFVGFALFASKGLGCKFAGLFIAFIGMAFNAFLTFPALFHSFLGI